MKLPDKVAIVTGGGSGMGEAISKLFADEGATVVVADRDAPAADRVVEEIRSAGHEATAAHVDVTDESQVCEMVRRTVAGNGGLDILVNCVGIAQFKPTLEVTLEDWRQQIDVNLTGVFLCCREAGKVMIPRRSGKIVNFGSTGGIMGVPAMAHYTAAKHGIVGLTRALAVEWGRHNIHVNCICPGATATQMLLSITTEEYRAKRSLRIPLQRLGKPEEQASTALFLASADSDYINGAAICTDGGVSAMSPGTPTEIISGGAQPGDPTEEA